MKNPGVEEGPGTVDNVDARGENASLVPVSSMSSSEWDLEPGPLHAHGLAARPAERPPNSGTGLLSPAGDASRRGPDAKPVSWRDLPRKDQLLVITLTRLSEPLVQTSLQSYMFYQLKWFDPSLPDSVISSQAGVLQYVTVSHHHRRSLTSLELFAVRASPLPSS